MPIPTFPVAIDPYAETPKLGSSETFPDYLDTDFTALKNAVNALPSHFGIKTISGLAVTFMGGALPDGTWQDEQALTLDATENVYVEIDLTSGVISKNTTGFTDGLTPLFFFKTDGGGILNLGEDATNPDLEEDDSISDRRGWAQRASEVTQAELDAVDAAALHKAGAETVTGVKTFDAYQAHTLNTPAQLTANQNNYALPTAPVVRLTSDAARDVTGLVATTARVLTLINAGAFNIVLKHESASSTAANRISVPSAADLTLLPNYAALLWYDLTTARWRVLFTWATGSGTAEANTFTFTQASHGLAVGKWIRHNGTAFVTADNSSAADAEVVGRVYAVDGDDVTVTTDGYVDNESGLTAGVYFLGTSGDMTATEPTTVDLVRKPIFNALSATSGFVKIYDGLLITAASVTGGGVIATGGFTLTVPATGTAALTEGIVGGQTILGGPGGADFLLLRGGAGVTGVSSGAGGLASLRGGLASADAGASGGAASVMGGAGSTTGTGGAGGSITITGGAAGGDDTTNRAGGGITLTAGVSKGASAGGAITLTAGAGGPGTGATPGTGGTLSATAGAGGANAAAIASPTGGTGGTFAFTSGAGGAASAGTSGTSTGGAGGTMQFTGGAGGAATATAGNNTGGTGAAFTWTAGVGGNATGATSGTNTGGNGGAVTLSAGAGGTSSGGATNNAGTGGAITVQGGAAAAQAGGAGGACTVQGRAGSSTGSGGAGGAMTVAGGAAGGDDTVNRAGGAVAINGGASKGTTQAGGAITLTAGRGATTGVGGAVNIIAGLGGTTSGAGGAITFQTASTTTITTRLTISATGLFTFGDACDLAFNTSTGSKIGTATTQKISLWNATPIAQPAGIADADGTLADITTKFNSLLGKLESFGLLAVA